MPEKAVGKLKKMDGVHYVEYDYKATLVGRENGKESRLEVLLHPRRFHGVSDTSMLLKHGAFLTAPAAAL